MISLPSGHVAGITSIRARYHALRLNKRVSRETPHHELRQMVDIVVAESGHSWLPGNPGYLFSGLTLDKQSRLNRWTEQDHRVFEDWLKQDIQVREIEAVRQRLVEDELPLIARDFDYPQQLYSLLKRRIEDLDMQRASPEQWRQTLLNMRRSGIREEELEWSGLLAYLIEAQKRGRPFVSRRELSAQIDFSPIRLSLTNELATDKGCGLNFIEAKHSKSLNKLGAVKQIAGSHEVSVLRYVDTFHYYKVGYLKPKQAENNRPQRWFALDTIGHLVRGEGEEPYFSSKEAAFNAASEHALQHVGLPVAYTHCSRYEHKTLCGGDDYREWLLTMPDYPISYYNKHYYERNLLLHFRTKQRLDQQGRRLLFVEEIQSDWHQSGAVKGYQNRWPGQMPPAPFTREWLSLALKLVLLHGASKGYDGIAWTLGEIQGLHCGQSLSPIRRLYDNEIPKALKRLVRNIDGAEFTTTRIQTKEPRLNIDRKQNKWLITDAKGRFSTRPRRTQREAMAIIARHCRQIELEVPMLLLNEDSRNEIEQQGFPLFGETVASASETR